MEYFYSSHIEEGRIFLDEEESHHCIKVMRHRIGAELFVTDGHGKLFRGKIIKADRRECSLELLSTVKEEANSFLPVHVGIAPTKNIDRFEWFLEKATEIGVTSITPVMCTRSERHTLKMERLMKVLLSAMKQSLRLFLPRLEPIIPLKEFVHRSAAASDKDIQRIICHCQSQNLPLLKAFYLPGSGSRVLIGPEGDFTSEEVRLAESNGFNGVTLGEVRLRTETAALVALHTIHLLND